MLFSFAHFLYIAVKFDKEDLCPTPTKGEVSKGVTVYRYIGILRYHFADSIYRYA